MKWALGASVGCAVVALFLLAVPGTTRTFLFSYPLWALPFIAFAAIRLIKEAGNPKLAKRLGVGLSIVLGASGLLAVAAAILFSLALSSWANSK